MKTPIAFFGSPGFAVPILEVLQKEFDVRLVVTQTAKGVGKNRVMTSTAVAQSAERLGLRIATPDKLKNESFRQTLAETRVEAAVVAAYGKILPQWLLDWPARGMINVHGSILPAYRGASPISTAILDGCASTGVTFIKMNARMDEGDILETAEMPIGADETTASLTEKLSLLAAAHINDVVCDYLAGSIWPQPQPGGATYTSLLKAEDGKIDFDNPPDDLGRRIRAYWPWPGVWGMWHDKRVKLLPDGKVQMEGKKAVPLPDFLRGHQDFPIRQVS